MSFNRNTAAAGFVLAACLGMVRVSAAAQPAVQITDDVSGSGCESVSPVPNGAANIVAWQSDCDPAGSNADGSMEIFRATVGGAPQQLTAGAGCTSRAPSVNSNGNSIAFESNCNLTGANVDANVEIFLWKNGVLSQLTNSTGCDNLAPSINGPGTFVAFDSTCNVSGTANSGRGSEIYRVSAGGVIKQLTVDPNGGACDSTSPSIDNNGSLVAFDSDCDLSGSNENFAVEIFTVNAGNLVVRQRTFSPDDDCSSVRPSMDASGSLIAFYGDCNLTGHNPDRSIEIFTVTVAPSPVVEQITAANDTCVSAVPHMASGGNAVAFTSFCSLNNSNGDKSIETFQVGVGKAGGGILAVTEGGNCSSPAGGISADGTLVTFDSECDPASNNEDGSVEVFRATACACGAPATRGAPKASDALFALNAAVGALVCANCECDTNNSGTVTAGDAQGILRAAVGQDVDLNCPAP